MEEDVTASVAMAVFGLDGFRVLAAEVGGRLELLVETAADLVGCPERGAVARPKDRRAVWVRDPPIVGRPVVICWHKRVWRRRTGRSQANLDRDSPGDRAAV